MNQKKLFLINVDTEAHRGKNPVDDLIYGKVCGGEYGINKIMEICEKYNVRATFFVDFAEVNSWGYDKIKNVCQDILTRGHDIQLHIHPEHFGDWNRQEFSQYSYEEQKSMIGYGVAQYEKIVGQKPIAFRAGKYSIDSNTLKVLHEYGIVYDSSFVKNNRWCKLNNLVSNINARFKYQEIIEVPVTVFKERIFNKEPRDKYYIFDVNGITKFEFRELYKKYADSELPSIILFMHSFSFLKRYKDDLDLKPNINDIDFFEYILDYVTNRNDFIIVTFQEYHNQFNGQEFDSKDFAPMINSLPKSVIGIFNRYRKASIRSKQFRKYVYGIYGLIALFGVLLATLLYSVII